MLSTCNVVFVHDDSAGVQNLAILCGLLSVCSCDVKYMWYIYYTHIDR